MSFFSWFAQNLVNPAFWFQPIFYSVHGWLATEMALWMLFHPYEPQYVPGTRIQLPFTPGIFPRGRHKLSISIANTITDILLTQEDIKKQAEKLITEENIYKTLDLLFDSVGSELRDISHIRRLYRYVDNLLPPLLQKMANEFILAIDKGDDQHFDRVMMQLLNRILPHISFRESQAEFLAEAFFRHGLTPPVIRRLLIDFLTPENTALLESGIKDRIGGMQGLIIRFMDFQKGFGQFRSFLETDAEEAEALLGEMMSNMNLTEKLKHQIMGFSVQSLPVETLEEFKLHTIANAKKLLIRYREDIVSTLHDLTEEATQSITTSLVHMDFTQVSENWLPGFKRDMAAFIYTYLNKELENMLSRALPAISLNTVIVEKIDQFSAKELEETIQRICSRELRWLAFLGAFLGFWLGLVSNIIGYWFHL